MDGSSSFADGGAVLMEVQSAGGTLLSLVVMCQSQTGKGSHF